MATLALVELRIKPGAAAQAKEFLEKRLPETRAYQGCQTLTTYHQDDGHTIVIVETWDAQQDHEKYMAWRQETGTLAEIGELLEGEPSIRYLEPLGV